MREKYARSGLSPDGTWYEISGSESAEVPVVMIHGVGLDQTMWEPQMAALEASYCVVRYDILGHGRSESRPVDDITTFVAQLEELLAYLNVDELHLVGLSMGGVISQAFAGASPSRLRTLVLMNTVYRRTEEELAGMRRRLQLTRNEGLAPIAKAAMDRWFDDAFRQQFPERVEMIRSKLLANDLKAYTDAYAALVEADAIVRDALKHVRCPALVLTGENDPGSTPAIAKRMVDDLDNAELAILPGLHHLASWEAPQTVNPRIVEFLKANH